MQTSMTNPETESNLHVLAQVFVHAVLFPSALLMRFRRVSFCPEWLVCDFVHAESNYRTFVDGNDTSEGDVTTTSVVVIYLKVYMCNCAYFLLALLYHLLVFFLPFYLKRALQTFCCLFVNERSMVYWKNSEWTWVIHFWRSMLFLRVRYAISYVHWQWSKIR